MEKITFCIPSKSNLRYLKTCIKSLRTWCYRNDHDIIVFVDEDTDGTVKWLEENAKDYDVTYYVNPYLGKKLYGIGKAYDYCIEKSNTDICMIFHADMMMGNFGDLNAYKHLKRGKVVCSTRIEPPLHPNAGEKILENFGMWPEEFQDEKFQDSVTTHQKYNKDKTTTGIFAPWMVYKEDILSIGGHDPRLKSCREDSDLFNRFKLNGYELIQSWDSLVYHLTGRGAGSFDGDPERHKAWQQEMQNSTKEFIRKWGSSVMHTGMMDPIITPKYDIGFIIPGTNYQLLEALEPWCNNILIDDEMQVLTSHYIDKYQSNTSCDLSKKIQTTPFVQDLDNDIVVTIDRHTFNQETLQLIQQLPQIIKNSGEIGEFQLGNLMVRINSMKEYQQDLISL